MLGSLDRLPYLLWSHVTSPDLSSPRSIFDTWPSAWRRSMQYNNSCSEQIKRRIILILCKHQQQGTSSCGEVMANGVSRLRRIKFKGTPDKYSISTFQKNARSSFCYKDIRILNMTWSTTANVSHAFISFLSDSSRHGVLDKHPNEANRKTKEDSWRTLTCDGLFPQKHGLTPKGSINKLPELHVGTPDVWKITIRTKAAAGDKKNVERTQRDCWVVLCGGTPRPAGATTLLRVWE